MENASRSRANIVEARAEPVKSIDDGLTIDCGNGRDPSRLWSSARDARRMTTGELLRGIPVPKGAILQVTRWRLTVEYDGGPFMGWQRQDHGPSVQQALEEALERMTGEHAGFIAAGRTDAGVHALAMTATSTSDREFTPHRLREGLNALVRPQPISILAVEPVAETGTPASRASADAICTDPQRRAPPALDAGRVWQIPVAA